MISPEPVPPGPLLAWAEIVTTDGSPAVATAVAWHTAGGAAGAAPGGTASGAGLPTRTPMTTPAASARTTARTTTRSPIRRAMSGGRRSVDAEPGWVLTMGNCAAVGTSGASSGRDEVVPVADLDPDRLRSRTSRWCTGPVVGGTSSTRHTFCVCLLAMDQLSVDDRMCRPAP